MFHCIISEIIQATRIKFAVKTVRLTIYMTIASLMILLFIQGNNCVKLDIFFVVLVV